MEECENIKKKYFHVTEILGELNEKSKIKNEEQSALKRQIEDLHDELNSKKTMT